jgi:hypothetical protein
MPEAREPSIDIGARAAELRASLQEEKPQFRGNFLVQFRLSGEEALRMLRLAEQRRTSPSLVAKTIVSDFLKEYSEDA